MTKARVLAGLTNTDNTGLKAVRFSPPAGSVAVYSTIDDLPLSGNTNGQQALITASNSLYMFDSGWYKIAIINNFNPQWITEPDSTYSLAINGTSTTITLVATDSDNIPILYSAITDSDFDSIATISHDSDNHNVWTVVPLDSENGLAVGGTGTVTFKASDGVNLVSALSTFTLSFGPPQIKITASDAAAGDLFGRVSSMSSDGNYIITTGYASEAAYIFSKSGSSWTQQAILTASDGEAADRFGSAVSISSDGSYAIVGAEREDGGAGNPAAFAGAAYIFSRSGSTWTQQAKLTASDAQLNDFFGLSVDISGDGSYAIAGAWFEDDGSGDPVSNAGAAYIFSRSGSTWTQQQKIDAPNPGTNEFFGYRVGLNSNGTYALISALEEDNGADIDVGSAYVFTRSGSTWTQQAKLLASDASVSDRYGRAVSLDANANYALVTSASNFRAEGGAAFIYTRSGSTWTQQAKITASDGQTSDNFGLDAELSSDGTSLVVGARLEDGGAGDPTSNAGAAYVFTRSGSTWTEEYKLTASDAQTNDNFGVSVSISTDGSYVIVGAENEDGGSGDLLSNAGAAYIFDLS